MDSGQLSTANPQSCSYPGLASSFARPPARGFIDIDDRETIDDGAIPQIGAHWDEDQDSDPDQNRAYYTDHGRFAGEVAAAIDVRAGLAPAATSNLVPFVDAHLFGQIDLHSPCRVLDFAAQLPLRAYADGLVDIYGQHVDPVEPVLGRERFSRDVVLQTWCIAPRGP
ncbi:hypothetical protein OIDMADRAFT_48998 [Oidiodendron maius Zn]|uniref:Uncharacterized protein n=1 Tax=Oidiodendron maius (strain Zn) TaxID=913774 RepID=A0A0C3HT80_OIDMZ|nr:hypothetical protein OIDMADRAFT_48998 [Oidiodendron maius Zn]